MTRQRSTPMLEDLVQTLECLFPQTEVAVARVTSGAQSFRLVPGRRHPRMLVSAGHRSAAADALVRPSAGDTFRTAAPRQLLSAILAAGLGPFTMPYGLTLHKSADAPDSIADYLAGVLGHPVLLSLTVGSARANRKPILNVHSPSGAEVGFAKIGLNALTNQLVNRESVVLDQLAGATREAFTLPRTLHAGSWRGNSVLLMSALRPDKRRQGSIPHEAAAAIMQSAPVDHSPIAGSPWLAMLEQQLAPLHTVPGNRLPALLDHYLQVFGDVEIPFGAWHGDFGPWNLAHTASVPMIWDWERYSDPVPAGIDVVHYTAHQKLRLRGDHAAARSTLEGVSTDAVAKNLAKSALLVHPHPQQIRAILIGYLLTIATRFTVDGLSPEGAPVRALADWHHDLIEDQLQRNSLLGRQKK